ncbi:MAG: RNA polymerase sigma factor [Acetatifactor sp.]|nr:RNA polymerase sigma factor [Acetatifactor sp.]MDE6701941.1 RNA polymerase sigma factor [Acetatifactor sp.]MDE7270962.1 RNA polymerase sigma factor [Acetatifactor sp.]
MTRQQLERCIEEHGKAIYSFCRHLAGNLQEAEDLYQDTFLSAVELSDRIDYESNPKSYLLSVAVHIWQNRKRKFAWRKRIADMRPIVDERDEESSEATDLSPEEQIIDREQAEIVQKAVHALPERLRIVVLLFYIEELSTAQIAAMMRIPKGTVLSRLHQARKLLKRELEEVFDEKSDG